MYPAASGFLSLFKDRNTIICIDEPKKVDKKGEESEAEFTDSFKHRVEMGYALPGQLKLLQKYEDVKKQYLSFPCVKLASFDDEPGRDDYAVNFNTVSVPSYNGAITELIKDLERYHREGYRVMVFSASKTRARRIADDISREGIAAFYSDNRERVLNKGEIMTFAGTLKKGFVYRNLKFAMLSDSDIFGRERKKRRGKKYSGLKIFDYNELKVGDFVVHEEYGIGIYRGIEKISQDRITKDYMKVEYAKGDNLYVPATSFDIIGKYSSSEGAAPKLNRLTGKEWIATKAKVKEGVEETARELVELYAERQKLQGHIYEKDSLWQKEFEELFPYEETADQPVDVPHQFFPARGSTEIPAGILDFGYNHAARDPVVILQVNGALRSGADVVKHRPVSGGHILDVHHAVRFIVKIVCPVWVNDHPHVLIHKKGIAVLPGVRVPDNIDEHVHEDICSNHTFHLPVRRHRPGDPV